MRRQLHLFGGVVVACCASLGAQAATPGPEDNGDVRAAGPQTGQAMTFDEAVHRAAQYAPTVRAAQAAFEGARAERTARRAGYFPLFQIEANGALWDEPLDIALLPPGAGDAAAALPPPQTPYEFAVAQMLDSVGNPVHLRDRWTADIVVKVIQPLTPLWTVRKAFRALDLILDTSRLEQQEARRQAALRAATAFFRFHQAVAIARAARESEQRIEANLSRLRALVAGGAARRSDVLKLEVAREAARQQRIEREAAVELARAGLAVSVGSEPGRRVEPVPFDATTCTAPQDSVEKWEEVAIARRPLVKKLRDVVDQLDVNVYVQRVNLGPQVYLIGGYHRVEGQALADKNEAFIQLALKWNVWDWGRQYYTAEQTAARARQVRHQLAAVRDAIRLEVRQAYSKVDAASRSVAVARHALAVARESYEIEASRFEAGDATVTDIIDAEAAVAEADTRLEAAKYECFIAWATLHAACGEVLSRDVVLRRTP